MQLLKDFVGVFKPVPCGYVKAPINRPAVLATGARSLLAFRRGNVIAAVSPPLTTLRLLITPNVGSFLKLT